MIRRAPSLSDLARRFGTDKTTVYLEQYERLLAGRRRERLRLLEIGVLDGASLALWRSYLPHAEIIGVDIDPSVRRFETELGVTIWIADQGDAAQLAALVDPFVSAGGGFDLVVDDGGHHQHQVITSFETLFPHVRAGGTYAIEDTGTAYWVAYGGKDIGEPGTSVAMVKDLLDSVDEPTTARENPFSPTAVTEAARARLRHDVASVEVYLNLVLVTKR